MVGWEEEVEVQIDRTAPPGSAPAPRSWSRPRLSVVLVAVAVLLVGGIVGLTFRPDGSVEPMRSARAARPRPAAPSTTEQAPKPTVAGVRITQPETTTTGRPTTSSSLRPPAGFATIAATADGVRVKLADGRVAGILGLDTGPLPEAQSCHDGFLAEAVAREIPEGTVVLAQPDPADPTGVYLVRVSDGMFLNELLLWQGAAPARVDGLQQGTRLSQAADQAARNQRGVWARCPGTSLPGGLDFPPVTMPPASGPGA